MSDDLDVELVELVAGAAAVHCRRCGTAWPVHGDAGGPVRLTVGGWSSPAAAVSITCPGFQWVDPGGPVEAYTDSPERQP